MELAQRVEGLRRELADRERELEEVSRKLKWILRKLAPSKIPAEAGPLELAGALEEAVDGLLAELAELESARAELEAKLKALEEAGKPLSIGEPLALLERIDGKVVEAALRTWERLPEDRKEVFRRLCRGFPTVDGMGVSPKRAAEVLEELVEANLVRWMEADTAWPELAGKKVYFPSLVATKLSLRAPLFKKFNYPMCWTSYQYHVLKESRATDLEGRLAAEVKSYCESYGYEVEPKAPVPGTYLIADLLARGGPFGEGTYLEVESLANELKKLFRKLDRYSKAGVRYAFVVKGDWALRCLVQRVALWAWERKLERYGLLAFTASSMDQPVEIGLVRGGRAEGPPPG